MAELPDGLLDAIRIVQETKSKAEYRGSRLKGLQSTITKGNYEKAERQYEDAKAAFDGWIRQLGTDVETGGEIDTPESYENTVEKAVLKAEIFVDYVDGLSEDPELGPGEWVTDLLATLPDVMIKIVREIRSVNKEEREALTKTLDELKWRELRDLPSR